MNSGARTLASPLHRQTIFGARDRSKAAEQLNKYSYFFKSYYFVWGVVISLVASNVCLS